MAVVSSIDVMPRVLIQIFHSSETTSFSNILLNCKINDRNKQSPSGATSLCYSPKSEKITCKN